jgi:hypothetical protein
MNYSDLPWHEVHTKFMKMSGGSNVIRGERHICRHGIRCNIEVFRAVTMKNGVFWDVMLCGSCKEELRTSFIRVTRIGELGTTLAVTSNRRTLRRNTNTWYFQKTPFSWYQILVYPYCNTQLTFTNLNYI